MTSSWRGIFCSAGCALLLTAQHRHLAPSGLNTPGVTKSMSDLKPEAIFPVEGAPDWLVVTPQAVWVSSSPKNHVVRLDPETNRTGVIVDIKDPCSGLAFGFDSVWVPSCGDGTVVRLNAKTGEIQARIAAKPADSEGGIAAGSGSIWLVTGNGGALTRIDPATNRVSREVEVPAGSAGCVFYEDAVWVTSPKMSVLTKVNAKNNQVLARIPVGPHPRFVTAGDKFVWTLNQGDGTISQVEAKTGLVVRNIPAGIQGPGGEIAFGNGSVWATVFGFPITRLDIKSGKVVSQWKGPGGDSLRYGFHSIWLSCLKEHQVQRIPVKSL